MYYMPMHQNFGEIIQSSEKKLASEIGNLGEEW